MLRSPLFWRLFGFNALLWLVAMTVLGYVIVRRIDRHVTAQVEQRLHTRARLMAELLRGKSAAQTVELQPRLEAIEQETAMHISLLDAEGMVLADSRRDPRQHALPGQGDRPEVEAARAHGIGLQRQPSPGGTEVDLLAAAYRTDDPSGAVAYIRVTTPLSQIREQVDDLQGIIWTSAGLTGLVGAALAFWIAVRLARPIRELTRAADQLAAGNYGHRVYAGGADEVGALARTFNHLSERLSQQITQLEADGQQLRTILGAMVEGVVALDGEQRILFANDRAAQLLDFPMQQADGRKIWELVRHRQMLEVVRRALAGEEPYREEIHWNGAANRTLTVHAARLPGRGAVLVLHDATELRRLERLRQEFVSNVSHELKTPLSVIKACAETLIDGAAEDEKFRGQFLEQIEDQAERLHALIMDLLSLARIESGEEVIEPAAVRLGPAVDDCVDRLSPRAQAKGHTLETIPPPNDVVAWCDPDALDQILENLVDNAIKYTPGEGRIRVRWWQEDGHACLDVSDTGLGIPERDLPRIFERFYRVDKARSRELGGTGLGLSIVKHLVQAMNGTIRAASQTGQGSTFSVRLPLPPAAPNS